MSNLIPFNGKTVVLVDGECTFCRRSVAWLRPLISTEIYFYAYQTADLVTHGISIEECEKSVQLIKGNYRSSGARAIADLLTLAGGSYRAAAMTVRTLGKLSDFGYDWIARNRGSELVIKISQFLPEDPDPLD
ncbi:MAG: DCC1-like thiol-disulfide oxidoreductase family protein [Actinomycetes bacterium]